MPDLALFGVQVFQFLRDQFAPQVLPELPDAAFDIFRRQDAPRTQDRFRSRIDALSKNGQAFVQAGGVEG